jgi:hypothetical protein
MDLAKSFWIRDCPSSVDSLFEMFVFASFWNKPHQLHLVTKGRSPDTWNHPSKYRPGFDPNNPYEMECRLKEWRRTRHNYGSIDGIRLIPDEGSIPEGTLHMVQVTTSDTHGFNFKYVKIIVENMENPPNGHPMIFKVKRIKITFIVPQCVLPDFQIKYSKEDKEGFTQEVQAMLTRFDWIGDLESMKGKMEVLGAIGWDRPEWNTCARVF